MNGRYMFVTKHEIQSRLESDDNLLKSLLLNDSPEVKEEKESDEKSETESNKDNESSLSAILSSISQEQLSRELGPDKRTVGRPRDAITRSTGQRSDIALMGAVLGHGLAADLLGVSTASSSLHLRGRVNHKDEDLDKDLIKEVKRKLNKVKDKASTALIKTFEQIENNNLIDRVTSAKEAVFVANGLAGVIQKITPKEEELKPTAQFIIMQPTVGRIDDYEVIDATVVSR